MERGKLCNAAGQSFDCIGGNSPKADARLEQQQAGQEQNELGCGNSKSNKQMNKDGLKAEL